MDGLGSGTILGPQLSSLRYRPNLYRFPHTCSFLQRLQGTNSLRMLQLKRQQKPGTWNLSVGVRSTVKGADFSFSLRASRIPIAKKFFPFSIYFKFHFHPHLFKLKPKPKPSSASWKTYFLKPKLLRIPKKVFVSTKRRLLGAPKKNYRDGRRSKRCWTIWLWVMLAIVTCIYVLIIQLRNYFVWNIIYYKASKYGLSSGLLCDFYEVLVNGFFSYLGVL